MGGEESPEGLASGRSETEIDGILTAAKLDKQDLMPIAQEILFDTQFSTREYRLMELNKEILETIEVGQILVFRGGENDSAVLCTEKDTYEVKEAETSNSLLLFTNLQLPEVKSPSGSVTSNSPCGSANTSLNGSENGNVDGDTDVILEEVEDACLPLKSRLILEVAHSYLEVKKMRPNLSKIRTILQDFEFSGSQEADFRRNGSRGENNVNLNTLLEKVPASEAEIVQYMDDTRVIDVDGLLWLVNDEYLFRILSQILNLVDENSWNSNEIDKHVVIQTLSSFAKPFFLEKVLQWFFEPVVEVSESSSNIKYTFAEHKICRFLGETLVKSMGKFNLKEFMKVWQESVPEGLTVNLKQLSGVAVYDEDCSPSLIWYFPEHSLPETFTERLALLFATKQRWKLDEISPFIEIFTPPSQNVGNLLTKYARSATVNGIKYYFSKHGK